MIYYLVLNRQTKVHNERPTNNSVIYKFPTVTNTLMVAKKFQYKMDLVEIGQM